MPCLTIALELAGGSALIREQGDAFPAAKASHRDEIPGVLGDDVCSDQIHLAAGVAIAIAGAGAVDAVEPVVLVSGPGRLDLDSADPFPAFHDEVVACAVAPGLGDDEAEGVGAGEKLDFGPLAFYFARAGTWGRRGHGGGGRRSSWLLH